MEEKIPPFLKKSMTAVVVKVKEEKEKVLAELLAEKIKELSNPERRTHVIAVLKGSDGKYYYGENKDQCLVDLAEYQKELNIKDMVVHAEMVALFKVPPEVKIEACYTTFDPCLQCLKHLVYRGCQNFYTLKRASKDWNSPERELFIKTYIPGGLH